MRALMTQKSCAVGMRNAILRNYLKLRFQISPAYCGRFLNRNRFFDWGEGEGGVREGFQGGV